MSTPSDPSGAASGAEGLRAAKESASTTKDDKPPDRPVRPESLVGIVISGRYRIEQLIGEGGMGAVYQAEHTHMHKRLAVKVLHSEMSRLPEVVARFEREALAAAHIEHPNVAAATDFGKLDDGSFFLVLEYIEGKSLRDSLSAGPLEPRRALHIARQIAGALGRAHSLGIVHRDLKPENVMLVVREGDEDFVKVLDFGIAKVPVGELTGETRAPGQVLTQLGMVYGTPEYMAPEQALGHAVDARADLYALGIILFEMLTGTRPYDNESKVALLGMHVTAPIPKLHQRIPDARLPERLDVVITRLLAKDSAARHSDAKELIEAFDECAVLLEKRTDSEPRSVSSLRGLRSGTGGGLDSMALGPTSLAQPSAATGRRFASLVGASLSAALRSAPPWLTPGRLFASAIVLAFAFVALVFAVARGGDSATLLVPVGPTPVKPQRQLDTRVNDILAAAQSNVDKGDFATAIDSLSAIEKKFGERADVHRLLERAYTGTRDTWNAMHQASVWLSVDPNAAADPKLEEDVRDAALFKEAQDEAFALLETKMGTRGLDILYDVAYGASGRQYPQAASRARHAFDAPEIRSRASPALALLLDFRDAKPCEAKHALLERARDLGDARLLSVLQPLESPRGCGFLGMADCYTCLHRDKLLNDAITSIEERASRSQ